MKIISPKVHAIFDYIYISLLIASPWVLPLDVTMAGAWFAPSFGIAVLIYTLLTNYEGGLVKLISMRAHFLLDITAGLLLVILPWVVGFTPYIIGLCVTIGLAQLTCAVMTNTVSFALPRHPSLSDRSSAITAGSQSRHQFKNMHGLN